MLTLSFFLATAALVLESVLLPHFKLLAYAPWIAIAMLKSPLSKAVWLAAFAGGVIDLLSDDPMGVHAINYAAAAALLYPLSRRFSSEEPLHLGILTAVISFASTLLQLFFLFLFDRRVPFGGKWVLGDLIGMPIADGIYALIWFAGPLLLYAKLRRYGSLYWRSIKQSLFPT